MADENNHRLARYVRYALIILALVLVALFLFFVAEYSSLRRAQIINMREMHISELLQKHAPLPVSEAGSIRTWMTFDYINRLFALPPDYLKTQLQIMDTRYPRLTLGEYTEDAHVDQTTFLGEVENAVRDYAPVKNATST